jgi:hypothetical protein
MTRFGMGLQMGPDSGDTEQADDLCRQLVPLLARTTRVLSAIEPVARTKELAGAPAEVIGAEDTQGCMMMLPPKVEKPGPDAGYGPNGSYTMLFDFITDPFGTMAKVAAKCKRW